MRSGKAAKCQSGKWPGGGVDHRHGCSRTSGLWTLDSGLSTPHARRGGAVLIVVMALLGTLTFLGFLFYTFSAQEQANAEYFAYADTPTPEFPASLFEDWFLEQVILGTRPSLTDSALYGSNWALVPNMIGRPAFSGDRLVIADGDAGVYADVNPFDGLGIGVYADQLNWGSRLSGAGQNGEFVFDYGGDGSAGFVATESNFIVNFSAAANPGSFPVTIAGLNVATEAFHPDAGYTYPDVNSMFLAYDGYVRDPNNPNEVYRVIIPSFHRPQYFPAGRGVQDGSATGSNPNGLATLYTDLSTANKVLRPHYEHANATDNSFQRFIVPGDPNPNPFWDSAAQGVRAQSGDTTRIIPPFPFTVNINGDGVVNEAGVWSNPVANTTLAEANDPSRNVYEFDVDCDGDGIRDAIWMDLDYPILDLPDGRQFVPLFACKIIDADALLNLNAHGNMNQFLARGWDGNPASGALPGIDELYNTSGGVLPLGSSNLGLSRSEINMGMGLTANPDPTIPQRQLDDDPNVADGTELASAQQQLAANLDDASLIDPPNYTSPVPIPPASLSNLELLALLAGREQYRGVLDVSGNPPVREALIEGRWGDDFKIPAFYDWLRGASSYDGLASPGAYLIDDDGDSNVVGYSPIFGVANPSGVVPPGYPAGFRGDDDISLRGRAFGHPGGGSAYRDPQLGNLWIPPFVHPLDYGGTGSGYLDSSSGSLISRRLAAPSSVTSPARFPTYVNATTNPYWQYQYTAWDQTNGMPVSGSVAMNTNPFVQDPVSGEYRSLYGVLPYWQALESNELQQANAYLDFLIDEGNEVILNRRFRNPEYDAVFGTHEMEGLHLSEQDFEDAGSTSRVRDLANINFDKVNDDFGELIRSRFTTDSWDRYDYGHGQSVGGTAQRDWEFTTWNHDSDSRFQTSLATFPPEFQNTTNDMAAGEFQDPLRRELRLILRSEFAYNDHLNSATGNPRFPRHRLNINRILSDDDPDINNTTAFDSEENPLFRNLTPHPDLAAMNLANTTTWNDDVIDVLPTLHSNDPSAIPAGVQFSNLNFNPPNNDLSAASDTQRLNLARTQEWWARYDRQRLARDIFTLLWVLGGGDDTVNYTTQSAAYTNEQIEEMAQFAVNYVDALDRDDAITKFEYDNDLTNGWNISGDDDPAHTDYRVVHGVEAQQLTLSEVIWIQTTDVSDETSTIWDDDDPREFLYIELRNAGPFDVEMRSDSWRIARYNEGKVPGEDLPDASFVFKTDPDETINNGENIVRAGQTFLIGCHDNSAVVNVNGTNEIRSSDFYVNDGTGSEFDQIIPFRIDGNDTTEQALPTADSEHPAPTLDLDLSYTNSTGSVDHLDRFEFDNVAPSFVAPMQNANTLVSTTEPTWSGVASFTLVLERRTNVRTDGFVDYGAARSDESEDGWIEVDRFEEVTPRQFNPTQTLADQLEQLQSFERSEPLDRTEVALHDADATGMPPRSHTLGAPDFVVRADADNSATTDRNQGNSNTPNDPVSGNPAFSIWQPHFDRDFSSVFELLSVPVIGPDELTEQLVDTNTDPKRLTGWYDDQTTPKEPALAGARFMNTDPDGTPANLNDDNRWYRLFEFLTVPDGGEDAIRERLELLVRTPGKINLNTVRDETVLAAILDDEHIGRFATANPTDDSIEAARNWYQELLLARDGIDPLNANAGLALPLPGVPGVPSDPTAATPTVQYGAVPFRSESYVAPDLSAIWPQGANQNKLSHTLLRSHVGSDDGSGTAVFPPARPALDQLGLFEARPTTDLANNQVDYHTRNRLLAKVANHTTNRSNVFAVWLTVAYFEAHQPDVDNPNVVQIGGELAGGPRHRAFFVIDRTRLEEAVEVDDRGDGNSDNDIITLNWRTFLLHRRTMPTE